MRKFLIFLLVLSGCTTSGEFLDFTRQAFELYKEIDAYQEQQEVRDALNNNSEIPPGSQALNAFRDFSNSLTPEERQWLNTVFLEIIDGR